MSVLSIKWERHQNARLLDDYDAGEISETSRRTNAAAQTSTAWSAEKGKDRWKINYLSLVSEKSAPSPKPRHRILSEYEFLDVAVGGSVEIKLGNDLLNDFICNAIEEPSSWQRENLQHIFNETLTQGYKKQA